MGYDSTFGIIRLHYGFIIHPEQIRHQL